MKNNNLRFIILFLVLFLFINCDSNTSSEKDKRKYSTSEIDKMLLKADMLNRKGEFENALANYKEIEKEALKVNYQKGVAKAYLEISNCYYNMSVPDKSIKYLFLAEQKAQDNPEFMARISSLKGKILFIANSYDEAEKKFRLAIEYSKDIKDKKLAEQIIDGSHINIASIDFQLQRYDIALDSYYKGFASPDKVNKIVSSINMAEIFLLNNKLDSANKYFQFAEKNIPIISEKELINYLDNSLKGSKIIYDIKKGDYENAIKNLNNIQGTSVNYTKEELLGTSYAKIGNRDSSIFYFQKNMDNKLNKKISDLKTFEASSIIHNEEKLRLKEIYQRQKRNLLIITFLSILCILALGFMFYYKQKTNKQNIQLLESDKENLRMEKEIAELRQEHIQKQVLATSIQLEQKNKFLEELKENIKNNENFNLNSYLKNEQLVDRNLNNIQDIIKEVQPNFFKKLHEISTVKLTNLDIKYAAYIYMNMDNSRIAAILKVDPKTVSVTKYRLKKKLGLNKEIDLEDYIRGM